MFNLIDEKWIPVIRSSGSVSKVAPWEISGQSDPPVKVYFTRPDFNSAVTQFLIGLVQTVMTPPSEDDWLDMLENPPSTVVLKEKMEAVRDAFELIDDEHPFMQEPEIDGSKSIDSLIITTPGENTIKLNKDFFIKHKTGDSCLCMSCTAAAVYTMQALAPMGGSGYASSIRGSSPLTTIIEGKNLMTTVLLNILSNDNLGGEPSDLVFPWMQEQRPSELFSSDNDPRMVYWTTVRRLKLGDVVQGRCMLCGEEGDSVSVFDGVKKGTAFKNWEHPLCPYYHDASEIKPVRVSENIGHFNQWSYMIYEGLSDVKPSKTVSQLRRNRRDISEILGRKQTRLWINGYLNDQALVRGWKELRQPITMDYDEKQELVLIKTISYLIILSDYGLKQLVASLKILYGSRDPNHKNPTVRIPDSVKEDYWSACDSGFDRALSRALSDDMEVILKDWGQFLRQTTISILDECAESIPLDYYSNVARSRKKLSERMSDKSISKELNK